MRPSCNSAFQPATSSAQKYDASAISRPFSCWLPMHVMLTWPLSLPVKRKRNHAGHALLCILATISFDDFIVYDRSFNGSVMSDRFTTNHLNQLSLDRALVLIPGRRVHNLRELSHLIIKACPLTPKFGVLRAKLRVSCQYHVVYTRLPSRVYLIGLIASITSPLLLRNYKTQR